MSVHEHEQAARGTGVSTWIGTVSSTRTERTDRSGLLLAETLTSAGHPVVGRALVRDDIDAIRTTLSQVCEDASIRCALFTGGTGISPADVTIEAIEPLLDRVLPGFGELFRGLSYQEVGPAAMLSRAIAGTRDDTLVFAMPGSPAACRLALDELILP
ncbi:MAG: MogA/MoaB family molybdenum cofactor biosynthesis protein, partial [Myxococcota bacterium]|nr:MogA/MoaB family molybdenum cofactor biosynthesis protein [Myxococcota bacterium]